VCWKCRTPRDATVSLYFCADKTCGAIQCATLDDNDADDADEDAKSVAAATTTHYRSQFTNFFSLLAMPEEYGTDQSTLKRAYLSAANAVHPDRYTQSSPREQRYAADFTAAVGTARDTLVSPRRRAAKHLWLRRGRVDGTNGALDGDHGAAGGGDGESTVTADGGSDGALLMEVMELHEAMEALETKGAAVADGDGDDGAAKERLVLATTLRDDIMARRDGVVTALTTHFDGGGGDDGGGDLKAAALGVTRLKYYDRVLGKVQRYMPVDE
jgi:hypothetical protein